MARSTFSPLGLPVGENNINMTYLYGISDFFSVMFEDTNRLNLLLESSSEKASEVYSKFLQLTSTISLPDIQKTSGETLKLITIKSSDAIPGEVNVYALPIDLVSSRYIANRPLLPTTLMEIDVDYRVELSDNGSPQIRFAKDISEAGFSTRLLADGSTKEYALWFVDAEIDEKWIYKYYGKLIGLNPESSTDIFKNYVYGLYYVYSNGPTVDLLRKGLNLTLGIPLARGSETVLEIRKYLETDQYVVITDANQYVLPYGLPPSVQEGQLLSISDEIAQWIEVKDYLKDGEWWLNLQIPSEIIPYLPKGQIDRYAKKGSHYDYLMRTYLKKHTFLVNVNVTFFKDNQIFNQLAEIIKTVKPSYTQAVYIWTILKDEVVSMSDDVFIQGRVQPRVENFTIPIERFYRGNEDSPLYRESAQFMRCNTPSSISSLMGSDAYTNGNPSSIDGGTSNGYINGISQYRINTPYELAWLTALASRGSEFGSSIRSKIGFLRGAHIAYDQENYPGTTSNISSIQIELPIGKRILPLYITTEADIRSKFKSVSSLPNFKDLNHFTLINHSTLVLENIQETGVFNKYFKRSPGVTYLPSIIPDQGLRSWSPPNSSYLSPGDYLVGIRILDDIVGVYLVTTANYNFSSMEFSVNSNESLMITTDTPISRGLGPTGSSFYLTRGSGTLNYGNLNPVINALATDESTEYSSTTDRNFSDTKNIGPVPITRFRTQLTHLMRSD
jgi:hypothetical protein